MSADPPSYRPQGAPRPRPDGSTARPVGEQPPRTRVMPAGEPPSYAPGSGRRPVDPTPTPPEYAVSAPGPEYEPPSPPPPSPSARPKRPRRGRKVGLIFAFIMVQIGRASCRESAGLSRSDEWVSTT